MMRFQRTKVNIHEIKKKSRRSIYTVQLRIKLFRLLRIWNFITAFFYEVTIQDGIISCLLHGKII